MQSAISRHVDIILGNFLSVPVFSPKSFVMGTLHHGREFPIDFAILPPMIPKIYTDFNESNSL